MAPKVSSATGPCRQREGLQNTEPEQFFLQTAACVEGDAFDAGRRLPEKLLWLP